MDNATLLPLNQIVPNPNQPRKVRGNPSPTLMASIRRFGVLQPIVVRPLEDGRYMIISGERWENGSLKTSLFPSKPMRVSSTPPFAMGLIIYASLSLPQKPGKPNCTLV